MPKIKKPSAAYMKRELTKKDTPAHEKKESPLFKKLELTAAKKMTRALKSKYA